MFVNISFIADSPIKFRNFGLMDLYINLLCSTVYIKLLIKCKECSKQIIILCVSQRIPTMF